MAKEKSNNKSNVKIVKRLRFKYYIGYITRVIFTVILFIVSFSFALFFATNAIDRKNKEIIKYNENNNIDYKVLLKPNDFYEDKYLGKDMIYVASLIDVIDINFYYNFNIEKNIDLDFNYKIIGDLVIADENGNKKYFEKEYTLLDNTKSDIKNNNAKSIKENIQIDYDYYNRLANTFKSNYGLDTTSYLKVYLEVEKSNDSNSEVHINDTNISSLTIPLSERSVEIRFDSQSSNSSKDIEINEAIIFNSVIFIFEVIFLFVAVLLLIKLINYLVVLPKKKSAYDLLLKKILKEYDRLIVETTTGLDKNAKIIKVKKFEELLDVRDNLNLPIMYYNIVDHQKAYFYINHQNSVYLFKLKAVDLEVKHEKKN